jgi:hypothetical protein
LAKVTGQSGSFDVNDRKTELTSFERKLILAMGLTGVDQLDELLAAPISQWAADHSEPPDEEYELADRMYEEADRQTMLETASTRWLSASTSASA